MNPQTTKTQSSQSNLYTGDNPASYLKEEYIRWQALMDVQSSMIQRFFEAQALNLAQALSQPVSQVRFSLPDKIVVNPGSMAELTIPAEQREQLVGGLMDRLMRTGLNVALRQRLDELEASSSESISIAAGLLRFSTAIAMIHSLLPSGRSIQYQHADGDEIPTIPIANEKTLDSAITAATDAIVGEETNQQETERGELLVPYVAAARRFFLPQWVAFDDQDRLLVNSTNEAEAHLASMQQFTHILHTAVGLAPYMVTDEVYQQKRYGMLGQIINQGRALARFQTREIVETIKRRAAANDLNRGLSLSLPYFDDQTLAMKVHNFDIIPAGRIMFVPAFVVLAVRKELAKVEQDTRLDRSTRKHLLVELQMLADAFDSSTTPELS
jgi:hypothetical protein